MADEDDFPDVPLTPQEQESLAISAEAKNDFAGEEPGVEDVVIEPAPKKGRKAKLTLGPAVEAPRIGHSVRDLRKALFSSPN